jgi:hypothetical protein
LESIVHSRVNSFPSQNEVWFACYAISDFNVEFPNKLQLF